MDIDFTSLQSRIADTPLAALSPLLSATYMDSLKYGDFPRWRKLLRELPVFDASQCDFSEIVKIGSSDDINNAESELLRHQLEAFIPWRKGPFELFGVTIDSEWRCQLKWERLSGHLGSLAGQRVLDVGSGNGYFGFRMLEADAELVIGIDPHLHYVAQFWALRHFAGDIPLFVLPATLEQMPERLQCFDKVFSMGVLYHRRAPLDHLQQLRECLAPGGELILETLYIDGEEGYSLTPENKYARMGNVWFVPSRATLLRWLQRCGLHNCKIIDESVTTIAEQRATAWMPFDSLSDALDENNNALTIEGLPAPRRVIVTATCQKK